MKFFLTLLTLGASINSYAAPVLTCSVIGEDASEEDEILIKFKQNGSRELKSLSYRFRMVDEHGPAYPYKISYRNVTVKADGKSWPLGRYSGFSDDAYDLGMSVLLDHKIESNGQRTYTGKSVQIFAGGFNLVSEVICDLTE